MKAKFLLLLLAMAHFSLQQEEYDESALDDPLKEEEDDDGSPLKKLQKEMQSKLIKQYKKKLEVNPKDCYLAIRISPLEMNLETDRLSSKLRFSSNCFPTRDVVFLSDYSKTVLNQRNHPTLVSINIFKHKLVLDYGMAKLVKATPKVFKKLIYTEVNVNTEYYTGKVNLQNFHSIILKKELSPYDLLKFHRIKSPVLCSAYPKRSMECYLNMFS